MKQRILHIHPADNVLVALDNLKKHEIVVFENEEYFLPEDIPAKHKFFMSYMTVGDEVIMYGVLVGKVQFDVVRGARMTTDNTKHASGEYAFRNYQYQWVPPDVSRFKERTFNGYHRSDGRVGTANYWLFIPTVFCENRNLDVIREALHNELGYAVTSKYKSFTKQLLNSYIEGSVSLPDISQSSANSTERVFKHIDGIKFLNHQGGCGTTRQESEMLSKLLAAYANHPNVGGITVLSLGCQHLQIQQLKEGIQKLNPLFDKPLLTFEQQQINNEEQLIQQAIYQTFLGLTELNKQERKPAPLSKLTIGVKCGGSDGFSGISANPAVGYCADMVVGLGGKILLAEFPELCGAEQNLVDRCASQEKADKFIHLMKEYDAKAHAAGSGFYMNPSPGNIKDGLITDAIKSAGAAKKGGTAPVADVLSYTEPAIEPGLNLVCTPGNDVEATTGKTAAGATLILFTTGLGTPTGNPVCPVIKVATNTSLANRMHDIIDINTGGIIEGTQTVQQAGEEILEYCIRAASGEVMPKAVQLNQDDFIPWFRGVSL